MQSDGTDLPDDRLWRTRDERLNLLL
jgi:hypothetical protein